jgi:hypothetical protein
VQICAVHVPLPVQVSEAPQLDAVQLSPSTAHTSRPPSPTPVQRVAPGEQIRVLQDPAEQLSFAAHDAVV